MNIRSITLVDGATLKSICPGCIAGSPAVLAIAIEFAVGTLTTLARESVAVPIPVI